MISKFGGAKVRVNLGSGKALMSQQLLDPTNVGTLIEQMGSKTVAQGVRRCRGIEPGRTYIFRQNAADASNRQPGSIFV